MTQRQHNANTTPTQPQMSYTMHLAYILRTSIIIMAITPGLLRAQAWQVVVYANPVMGHIGNVHIHNEGSGVLEYSSNAKWQKEAGMRLRRGVGSINGLSIGIGLGIKELQYSLDYIVLNLASPAEPYADENRSYSLVLLGPTLALEYELSRFTFLMGIDIGIAIDRHANFGEGDLLRFSASTVIVREFDFIDYSVNIQENSIWPHDSRRVYDLPELRVSYQLVSGLSLHIGSKIRPYGSNSQHSIVSSARYIDSSSDRPLFQNLHVNRKTLIGYIGLSYRFGL